MRYLYSIPLFAVMSLSGCDTQNSNQNSTQTTTESEVVQSQNNSTTEYAEYQSPLPDSAPTYKVSTTGKQPPYSFLDENGKLQGIDIDVIRMIGEEQGFKVDFFPVAWQEVFPSVVEGKTDMAISGISYNDERNEKYLLSKSYLFVPSAIMYKDSNNLTLNALSDLKGKRFSGMTDSKQLNDVKNNVTDVEIIETETMFQAYQQLIQDNTDAIAEDIHWLQYMAKDYPEYNMKIVPYETEKDLSSQQIIMFKKGNDELAESINEGIDKLIAQGKIDEIEKKWLGE